MSDFAKTRGYKTAAIVVRNDWLIMNDSLISPFTSGVNPGQILTTVGYNPLSYNAPALISQIKSVRNTIWEPLIITTNLSSFTWDTTSLENGEYSLMIEVFSDGLGDELVFGGVVTIANPVDTPTSSITETSSPVSSKTSSDAALSFNSLNIGILGLISALILVRKRKSKFV